MTIKLVDVVVVQFSPNDVKGCLAGFGIQKDGVTYCCEFSRRVTVRTLPLPDNFAKGVPTLPTKHRIANQLEIVRRRRVAVEVEAAGRFEYTVNFDDPQRPDGVALSQAGLRRRICWRRWGLSERDNLETHHQSQRCEAKLQQQF